MQILQSKDWDPEFLCTPNPELVQQKEILAHDTPFVDGKQLIVDGK